MNYDYDFFVIGAGSGGVRAARIAAQHGARVAIAEDDKVGGTCVIRGCVPKKLFVHAAHFADELEDSIGFGWTTKGVKFDWPTLRDNVNADTDWLSGIYIRNLERSGAELIRSRAVLEDAHTIRLVGEDRSVTAKYILIATGGRPVVDESVPGFEHAIVSDDLFHLERLPRRMVIIGGGYIALEFAAIFNAFAVETTVAHRGADILRGFDADVRKAVHAALEHRGIDVSCGTKITRIERKDDGLVATTTGGDELAADQVLFAIGRSPNTVGLGLEEAGVVSEPDGRIEVDRYSRTNVESIYAVGDVTNRIQLTPIAIREGEAVADTLFGGRPTALDHADIPTAVFTQPEVGTVGLTEEAAKAAHDAVDIYKASFKPLHHRVAGREERMLLKLVVDGDTDRVLGFHGVGDGAAEMAQLVAVAIKMGATKADFDATVALHPTQSEELVTMRSPVERHRTPVALPEPAPAK
ncbi:glutathione-disulfide reductase [Bauldia litoralis]|uniref:Glutathione reductase n=1 Tax=Bauldia litoralis TaxID=665467 RepID=A0A1G6CHF3_9HYPH|nr:glutathione-disulfide reductase [Bauldia litoralis]SDB32320.1 NADPH-glutathione reductase [Bauldia litoralis]